MSPPSEQHPRSNRKSRYPGLIGKYKLLSEAVNHFIEDDCATMAAALAYYTTFSITPLLLIVISILGLLFERQTVQHRIQDQIQGLIGQGAANQVEAMLTNASQHSSTGAWSAILGVVALLVGATGAFTQLQSSLNRVWHVKPDPQVGGIKNFIVHRILSSGMMLAFAFLLLVSLVVSAAISTFSSLISGTLPHGLSAALLSAIDIAISIAIITVLFAAMFKVLPDAKIDWRDVWGGAAITSVLFTLGKFGIGMYLAHSGAANVYGAAGSFVLIVLWIYYSSLILLFGAELTAVWAGVHTGDIHPKTGAVRVQIEEATQR